MTKYHAVNEYCFLNPNVGYGETSAMDFGHKAARTLLIMPKFVNLFIVIG